MCSLKPLFRYLKISISFPRNTILHSLEIILRYLQILLRNSLAIVFRGNAILFRETISLECNIISRERNNISRERNMVARERNSISRERNNIPFRGSIVSLCRRLLTAMHHLTLLGAPMPPTYPLLGADPGFCNREGASCMLEHLKLEFHRENRTHRAASGRKNLMLK